MDVILELLNHIESERLILLILWFLLLWRIWKLDGLKPYLSIKRVRILLNAAAGIATVMLAACLFFVYIPTEPFFQNQSKYLFLAGILLFGSASLAVLAVIYNIWLSSMRKQIKEVKRQSEEDLIRAYALLKKMDPDQMVPSIKKEFVRELSLIHIYWFGQAQYFIGGKNTIQKREILERKT